MLCIYENKIVIKVLCPTQHKIVILETFFPANLSLVLKNKYNTTKIKSKHASVTKYATLQKKQAKN